MKKKAYVRTIEAVFAIMIVLGTSLIVANKNKVDYFDDSDKIFEMQSLVLNILTNNDSVRKIVMDYDISKPSIDSSNSEKINILKNYVRNLVPYNLDYSFAICEIDKICSPDIPRNKEVYSSESIITSSINSYSPKKLRFFVWKRL